MYQSEVMDPEHHVVITYWTTPPNLHTNNFYFTANKPEENLPDCKMEFVLLLLYS